jgi:acyl-coenzyme A thioesterase PaaI-like protein
LVIDFDMVKQMVPFVGTVGIEASKPAVADDGAVALQLTRSAEILNHLSTFHAGALFTLGETVGGYAIVARLGPALVSGYSLIAAGGRIDYGKLVREQVECTGRLLDADAQRIEDLAEGEVHKFSIALCFVGDGRESGTMTVDYSIKRTA